MDNEFLLQYIHLEKLCSEIYGEEHGVTSYIKDMESTDSLIQRQIPNWTSTYKKLKELRWKRNTYTHEGLVEYNEEDTVWLKQFYVIQLTEHK